jgi:hypothetical protein
MEKITFYKLDGKSAQFYEYISRLLAKYGEAKPGAASAVVGLHQDLGYVTVDADLSDILTKELVRYAFFDYVANLNNGSRGANPTGTRDPDAVGPKKEQQKIVVDISSAISAVSRSRDVLLTELSKSLTERSNDAAYLQVEIDILKLVISRSKELLSLQDKISGAR